MPGDRTDGVTIEDDCVVHRGTTWLGGERRSYIPVSQVTSCSVKKTYSVGLLVVDLLLGVLGGVVAYVVEPLCLVPGVLADAVLAVAAVWMEDTLVVESPTESIPAEGRGAGREIDDFVAELVDEVE